MRTLKGLMLAAAVACAAAAAPGAARAAETSPDVVKIVGYVTKIDVAADGKSAVATLLVKGKRIPITIKDELTLKKFKIKKIRPDDEIKCSYRPGENNLSVSFLRTAGC